MRWTPCLFLLACATPTAQTTPAQTTDIPPHTQALMDAYKNVEAQRAMRPAAPAPMCPGDATPLQQRERYLRAIGGCVEPADPRDPSLDLATRAQWPALYAALDAQEGVDRCLRYAHAYLGRTGPITLRAELASDGALTSVHADGEQGSDIACCARRALQAVKLPAPGRPLAVQLVEGEAPKRESTQEVGLRKDAIKAVISAHDPELPGCFESAIRAGLNHGGRITVRFVIAPSGEVVRAMVESDELGAAEAGCCLVGKVRSWTFPKPQGDAMVIVTYPFLLQL